MKLAIAFYLISGIKVGIEHLESDENHCVEVDFAILRVQFIWSKQ